MMRGATQTETDRDQTSRPARARHVGASGASRARGWRDAIDARLARLLDHDPQVPVPLADAMRAAALAPGKRLRPLVALAATRTLGGDPAAALDAACALEMVHCASLVLDDLPCMDDAAQRRGRPALHRVVGEDITVLAAIALLSRAFEAVGRDPSLSPAARTDVVVALARCTGAAGLSGGQHEDLRGADRRDDLRAARRCNQRKTGAAFVAAVEIGALVAGATPVRRARLRRFAQHLGCAFQLRDDLLDATASCAQTGKDSGQDVDRRTTVSLIGIDGTSRLLRAHLQAARRALSADAADAGTGDASPLMRLLDETFGDDDLARSSRTPSARADLTVVGQRIVPAGAAAGGAAEDGGATGGT